MLLCRLTNGCKQWIYDPAKKQAWLSRTVPTKSMNTSGEGTPGYRIMGGICAKNPSYGCIPTGTYVEGALAQAVDSNDLAQVNSLLLEACYSNKDEINPVNDEVVNVQGNRVAPWNQSWCECVNMHDKYNGGVGVSSGIEWMDGILKSFAV